MKISERLQGTRIIADYMEFQELGHPYTGAYKANYNNILHEQIDACMPGDQDWYFYPKFETSWDWLIPVCKQLKETHTLAFKGSDVPAKLAQMDLEGTFKAVVELIKYLIIQKTEDLIVGNVVIIKDSELPVTKNWLGEGDNFKHQGPYIIEKITDDCVTKLSGIKCSLHKFRFNLYKSK